VIECLEAVDRAQAAARPKRPMLASPIEARYSGIVIAP
jgi:hypothetical protein